MRDLKPRQRQFVQEYLIDFNAAAAARRAGYSVKRADATAHNLLRTTEIAAALQKAMARRAERAERTALDVLRDIRETFLRARDAGDYRSAIRSLELEGKHLGMFAMHNAQRRPLVSVIDFTSGQRRATAGVTADHESPSAAGQPSD